MRESETVPTRPRSAAFESSPVRGYKTLWHRVDQAASYFRISSSGGRLGEERVYVDDLVGVQQ